MADLGDVVEEPRRVEGRNSGHDVEEDPVRRGSTKRKRLRKRRNSGGSLQASAQPSPSGQVREESREENESNGQNIQQKADGRKQDTPLIQDDHQARFYADYRKVADEYDKEFLEKYTEDLDTTLIFAGLFSAVTSAFIIEVDSRLKPDPGDETTALLRVLIYEINNAAFGADVPTLPQWTGPPSAMVQVQAVLFASLVISLLSAFLAMLGKQWLNRYASTDMRGSAVERSRNRQRKLDGIVAWYFNNVLESLPLMLQVALLLLGCALSRYLWDISITVASVVIGITSFGLVFYLFIVVAGTVSVDCPYQTPGSQILRHLGPRVWNIIRSVHSAIIPALRNTFNQSWTIRIIMVNAAAYYPWWSRGKIIPFFKGLFCEVPFGFAVDCYLIGRAAIQVLSVLLVGAYRLGRVLPIRAYHIVRTLGQQMAPSDFRCISWTFQTSLDKSIHLTTSKHLATISELTDMDPTLVVDCFNVFIGCISFNNDKLAIMQGLEQLTTVSAGCLFRTFRQLWVTDPTSSVLMDLRRRYSRVLPLETNFNGLPFYHTIVMIHAFAHERWDRFQWDDYRPSGQEHIPFAQHMVKVAQVERQRMQRRKVPRWILRFALHSLSLDPPSPASVIADCLTIVATELGCDYSNITTSDESARVEQVSNLIIQQLKIMVDVPSMDTPLLRSKHKAIATLFPYATRLEQDGQPEMFDVISHASRTAGLILQWRHIRTHITALFDKSSPPSLNRAIALMPPCPPDFFGLDAKNRVLRWAIAASAVQYSEEVCQSVVNMLLQISNDDSNRSYIPVEIWTWLKKRPSLPPTWLGQSNIFRFTVVHHVRGLGDIEILKSFLLLVWSEWSMSNTTPEVEVIIQEDFGGIGVWGHRDDLIKHLNHVQGQLDRGLEYFKQHNPQIEGWRIRARKSDYGYLKDVLLEVDKRTMETLTQSHTTFACALPLPCP